MSIEEEILALEDRRIAAMTGQDFRALDPLVHGQYKSGRCQPRTLKLNFLNAWTRTPQGWKFVAWQSCPQPA